MQSTLNTPSAIQQGETPREDTHQLVKYLQNNEESQVSEQLTVEQPETAAPVEERETEEEEEGVNLFNEASSVVAGGAIDAVESIGGFAELTGDTVKTGLGTLLGKVDATQNPFDTENYVHGDGDWLNVPDKITDWNGNVIWEDAQPKTAIGKFGRGLVEFGILAWLTAKTGGVAGGALSVSGAGARGIALARTMGMGTKGARMLKFVGKGVKIGSEGAIADLISSSSEHANIMNLAQENIPWAVPIIGDMVAVKPEDNPWTARLKSVMAGAGMNYVGHAVGAVYKGFWAAGRARMAGKSVDEANIIGNEAAAADFDANMARDEIGHTEMALDDYQQGIGKSRAEPLDEYARTYGSPEEYDEFATKRASGLDEDAVRSNELFEEFKTRGNEVDDPWFDDIQTNAKRLEDDANRPLSRFVNDNQWAQNERATYTAPEGAVRQHVQEAINDYKAGGDGIGHTPMISESYLRAISRGDANIRQYVEEVADDLTNALSRNTENRLNWKDTKTIVLKQANDLLDILDGGSDIAANFKTHLDTQVKKQGEFRLYSNGPDNSIVTISPTQKAANVLVLNALAKQVQSIAKGSLTIRPGMTPERQAEMVFDSMKVLLKENKKMGMLWGLDGRAQQEYVLSPTLARMKKEGLDAIDQAMDEYHSELRRLLKEKRWDDIDDLMELNELSGGKVRVLAQTNEFLRAKLVGGRMDGIKIEGRLRKEMKGAFYNSVLSSFATPVKAVLGTNMIAWMRPLTAFLGSAMRGNEREMFMATAQMQNMGQAWAESLQMAKHNWDLGVKRQGQSYQGKVDFDTDIKEWKSLKKHYEKNGTPWEQNAYGALDKVVDINTSPWVKYSMNAMGSGDAAARTIIGRQFMRQRAAQAAWDARKPNMNTDDLLQVARDTEENFRDEIFRQDKDGFYIVSDRAASLAGDYAAMTRSLQENFKGFELIANIPGMKAFFPFVRTGFNYLDVTFDHTPLALFKNRYQDIKQLAKQANPNKFLLAKYNLRPEDIRYELAILEGRMAIGTAAVGLATIAALNGKITGNEPVNAEDREHWKLNGIKPKSFKIGDTYVSYERLEIFNTIFSSTADVVGNADALGEKRTDEWMKKLTYMTASVVVDQSMLSGVEDLARLMNPRSSEDLLVQSGSRYIRAHLPYAGLMGQIGDVLDANQRESDTLLEQIARRDALFKRALPPKFDILSEDRSGTPLRYGPEQPLWRLFNSLSPIGIYQSEGDPIKENLMAMNFNIPNAVQSYRGIPLNSLERSALMRELSKGNLRERLRLLFKNKGFLAQIEAYKKGNLKESDGYRLRDTIFHQAVAAEFKLAKDIAMSKIVNLNPRLRRELSLAQQKRLMLRQGGTTQYERQGMDRVTYLVSHFPK